MNDSSSIKYLGILIRWVARVKWGLQAHAFVIISAMSARVNQVTVRIDSDVMTLT